MTRAVLDPSVLISSFIGRPDAAPGRVIRAWRDGRFTLVVLVALARRSAADFLVSLDLDLLEAPLADLTVLAPAAFLIALDDEPQTLT